MPEEIKFEKEIIKLLDREPFFPFNIVLTSGDRYSVADPHSVAFGESTVVVFQRQTGMSFFRKNQIIAVNAPELAG
jgi:hypothetical protein